MKNSPTWFTPFRIKMIAGLHIFLQAAFPLAVTVNPTVSFAAERESSSSVYTLSPGETVVSVAQKYHTTVQELRKLNQFRTFARGFDNLQAGDELDVPSPGKNKKRATSSSSAPSTALKTTAGIASRLASSNDKDAITSTAFGFLNSEVSKQIQQWLEKVGTAQIQLALDKDSGLKNSQFDMLIPLSERDDRLIFSQQSLHRTDDRTQMNLGFGYRAFHKDWMLGGNTFFDYDLSRGHMRMGAGVEYWRDFMKLGANSYLRLSNWQNSPDMEDYEERPANGWDIRAQAWLPALPQLGGEVIYEQYYGDQVALFGKENRQRNPHAVTLGVNYTPFPLLTLNAAQSMGASGKNDTRVGIQLRYQPGETWQKQTDPGTVAQMRSLAANRHALVERNNNIVLDYRKKVVIRLQTTPLITGYAGEEKSLGVAVNSKYSLDKINWSAEALIAAGGKIVKNSATDYSVILPDYQTGPNNNNTYIIRGVAVDSKGNASPAAETQVTVTQGAINTATSTFSPARIQLPADGKTQQQLVLHINDKLGKPVDVAASDISVRKESKLRGKITSTLSDFTRQAPGVYVATLTAGTKPENVMVTPFARNNRFTSSNIVLTADNASAQLVSGSLTVVKDNAKADGKETNSVKATVMDAAGNLVRGQVVSFTANNNAIIETKGTTDAAGEVKVTLTSTKAGQSTVSATLNGNTQRKGVTFVADSATAHITAGNLVVIKDSAKANGTDTNSVKAIVTDAHGNAVAGETVNFSADNGATIAATGTTGSDGSVTVTLTSKNAGKAQVTASINASSQTQALTFVADNATAQILSGDLVIVKDNAKANGTDTNSVKATVKDAYGNRVANVAVSFAADNNGKVATTATTDAAGEVIIPVTSTKAGQSTLTATINTSSQSQKLTFVADSATAQIASGNLVVVKDNAKANGSETNSVKATVTDAHGNTLAGEKVNFSADNGATIAGSATSGSDGSVMVTLTNTKAGKTQVTATVSASTQSQTLNFIADSSTAQITSSNLVVVRDNALANGSDQNRVEVTVTDANGNLLTGQTVNFSADNGATIASSATTGGNGSVTLPLTSTKAGQTQVTATINGSSQSKKVSFVANGSTAQITNSDLVVVNDNAPADGKTANSVKATVTDAYGNTIAGYSVRFQADNGATIAATGTTGSDGSLTMPLTNTKAGQSKINVTVNGGTRNRTVTFVADSSTAQIVTGDLVIMNDNAKANGTTANSVKATVKDANGNLLSGVTVNFSADNGATIATSGTTDSNGSVTMPLTSTKAGKSNVTATINNSSQSQAVTFVADSSTAQIISGDLSIVSDNAVANGSATNSVKATVKDAHGNILAGQTVNFSADNGATIVSSGTTNASGEVTMTLISKKAGQSKVTASINGSTQSQTLTFKGDSATAQILSGDLVVGTNNAAANGKATNSVKATVTDANGNLVSGLAVNFTANNGATIAASGTTGSDGSVTVTLTSTKAGQSNVTASVNGSSQNQTVTFVADSATAHIVSSDLVAVSNNALANGTATNSVKAVVKDANDNLLSGLAVSFSADNGATIAASGTTGSDGSVTMTLTSTKAGQSKVTASINGSSQSRTLTFVADSSTAQVNALAVVRDNAKADGILTNSVKATVTDAHGNTLTGQTVSFTADNGASITGSGTSDANGEVTVTLTSTTVGQSNVVATLKGSSQSVKVTFAPTIVRATVTEVTNHALSDGTEMNKYIVRLTDTPGNPVAGITPKLTLTAGSTAVLSSVSPTDSNGETTFTVKASQHGDRTVQVDVPNYPNATQQVNTSFDNPPYTLSWSNVRLDFNIPIEWSTDVDPVSGYTQTFRVKNANINYNGNPATTCPVNTEKPGTSVAAPDKKIVLTRMEVPVTAFDTSHAPMPYYPLIATGNTGAGGELYGKDTISSGSPAMAQIQDNYANTSDQTEMEMEFEDGTKMDGVSGKWNANRFNIESKSLTESIAGASGIKPNEIKGGPGYLVFVTIDNMGPGSKFTLTAKMVGNVIASNFSINYGKGDPGPCY